MPYTQFGRWLVDPSRFIILQLIKWDPFFKHFLAMDQETETQVCVGVARDPWRDDEIEQRRCFRELEALTASTPPATLRFLAFGWATMANCGS
jgi:hypothetical protein